MTVTDKDTLNLNIKDFWVKVKFDVGAWRESLAVLKSQSISKQAHYLSTMLLGASSRREGGRGITQIVVRWQKASQPKFHFDVGRRGRTAMESRMLSIFR